MDASRSGNVPVAEDEEKRVLRVENAHLRSQLEHIRADSISALSRDSASRSVDELRNVVERMSLLSTDRGIEKDDLVPAGNHSPADSAAPMPLAEVERIHIQRVLVAANWHQGNAAAALGISSKTLYRKIREYGFARSKDSTQPG